MCAWGSLQNFKYKEKHIEWVGPVDKIKRQVFHIAELCTGVGYGKSASPFHWGSTGASLEKLFFGGSWKVHFSALHLSDKGKKF